MKRLLTIITVIGMGGLITACSNPDKDMINDTAEKIAERNRQAQAPSLNSPKADQESETENQSNEQLEQLRAQIDGLQQQLNEARAQADESTESDEELNEEMQKLQEERDALAQRLEESESAAESLAKLLNQDSSSDSSLLNSAEGLAALGLLSTINDYRKLHTQILGLDKSSDEEEKDESAESADPRCQDGAVGTSQTGSSLDELLRTAHERYSASAKPETTQTEVDEEKAEEDLSEDVNLTDDQAESKSEEGSDTDSEA